MKIWRVQFAYGLAVNCPTVHKDEAEAQQAVLHWFSASILPSLELSLRVNEELGQNLEYVADGKAVLEELVRRFTEGDVWGGHDLYHDFLDRHEGRWTYPMWVKLGTVNVDTREAEPLRKRRLMPVTDVPPILEYDPGEGLIMGPGEAWGPEMIEELKKNIKPPEPGGEAPPPAMGAKNVWRIEFSERGEAAHPSFYTDEERAKEQVAGLLVWIINEVQRALPDMEKSGVDPALLSEAFDAIMVTGIHLDRRDSWGAYEVWKKFEEEHGGKFKPSIPYSFGTLRVRKL